MKVRKYINNHVRENEVVYIDNWLLPTTWKLSENEGISEVLNKDIKVVDISRNEKGTRTFEIQTINKSRVQPTYDDLKPVYTGKENDSQYLERLRPIRQKNVTRHLEIVLKLNEIYQDKNMKYGDSFSDTVKEYGNVAALTRMADKFKRIEQFTLHGYEDSAESLKDSLKDIANYAIMYLMILEEVE